jgi:hypothetical protein
VVIVSLAVLMAGRPDEKPVAQQSCTVEGRDLVFTATLARTAVVEDPGAKGTRWVVPLGTVMVREDELRWEPVPDAVRSSWMAARRGRSRAQHARREPK